MAAAAAFAAHGLGLDPVAGDWPPLQADAVEQLLHGFANIGTLRALSWHSPRPFSAACLVQTSAAPLFVKRHHRQVRQASWLHEEHRFMRHLREHGAPVAQVFNDRHGASAIALGDWTYEVHAVAEGLDLYRDALSWSAFHHEQHAHAAGQALARLHLGASAYSAPARRTPVLLANFRLLGQVDPLAAIDAELGQNPALAAYLGQRDWRAELQPLLFWHQRLQPLLAAQPPLWTHNDWHASNLLWSADRAEAEVSSVLDFGLADRTFALFDLATAVERNSIPWLDLDGGGRAVADLNAVDALLAGYHRIKPLSAHDLRTLSALLPLVHVDFALAEVAYFDSVVGSRASADIAYHAYLLGHARWFAAEQGQELLEHLARLTPATLHRG